MRESIEEKADRLVREGKVKLVSNKRSVIFEVEGSTETHTVIFKKSGFSCDCMWWSFKFEPCSHIMAAMMYSKSKNIRLPGLFVNEKKYYERSR